MKKEIGVLDFFTRLIPRLKAGPVSAPLDQIAANEISTRSAGIRQEKRGWRTNFSDDDIINTFNRLSEYGQFKNDGQPSLIESDSDNIVTTTISLMSGEKIDIFVTRSERRLFVGTDDEGIKLKTPDALVDYLTIKMAEL